MRVCIVNCPPDHNKGAAAILAGLISRLKATGFVDDIAIVSTMRQFRREIEYRHLATIHPDVRIMPSLVFSREELFRQPLGQRGSVFGHLLYASYLGWSNLEMLTSAPARRHGSSSRSFLATSDLLLNRGGPFIEGLGPPPNPTLLYYLSPFLYARRLGVPYAFVGETLGGLGNPWARFVTRKVFRDAAFIGFREATSANLLESLGIRRTPSVVMLDNAFWIEPRLSARVEAIIPKASRGKGTVLAVTCRPWGGSDRYLEELAGAIDTLLSRTFEHALLVANNINPTGWGPDDRAITGRLLRLVQTKDRVSLVDDDLAPDELAALYGNAALIIGTRLHSLILGLVGGTRALGISYWGPKTDGVMDLLGLSDYVLDIDRLDRRKLVDLAERAVRVQPLLAARLPQLRREHNERFVELLQTVRHRPSR